MARLFLWRRRNRFQCSGAICEILYHGGHGGTRRKIKLTPITFAYSCSAAHSSLESCITGLGFGLDGKMLDDNRTAVDRVIGPKPSGFTAVGIFLFFGALMASLAATTLLWRGTVLDRVWALNPMAYRQLAPLGNAVGTFFLLLAVALATAGIGWFRHRLWGWKLSVVIIS